MTETVSVVVPAFNAQRFVRDAVDSVLAQTHAPVECIVVDDGSSDSTGEVIRGYGSAVRLIEQENRGVAAARNRGAAEASGKILAFLDADDLWLPTLVERQVPLLTERDAAAVVCANRVVDEDLHFLGTLRADPPPTARSMLLQEGSVLTPPRGMIIRRDVFESMGGFDTTLSTSADWEYLLRLLANGPVAYVGDALCIYRKHAGGMSVDVKLMEHDMLSAYGKAFEREVELRPIRRRAYARLHWMIGGSYWNDRKVMPAARHVASALVREPRLVAKLGRTFRGRAKNTSLEMTTLDRLRPVRSLPSRALWRLNTELSRLGERHQRDWLIYNPIQMYAYHRLARRASGPAMAAIDDVFPEAQMLVDVGAGSGATAAQAARIGKRVVACEKSRAGRLIARIQGVRSVPFDLQKERPAQIEGPVDLAYCFEVAEHLPPELGDRLVVLVAGLAPIVVFSAAQPGQGGLAHINEQPLGYWRKRFQESGCEFDPDLTEQYRARVKEHGANETWLLANVSVFLRRD